METDCHVHEERECAILFLKHFPPAPSIKSYLLLNKCLLNGLLNCLGNRGTFLFRSNSDIQSLHLDIYTYVCVYI